MKSSSIFTAMGSSQNNSSKSNVSKHLTYEKKSNSFNILLDRHKIKKERKYLISQNNPDLVLDDNEEKILNELYNSQTLQSTNQNNHKKYDTVVVDKKHKKDKKKIDKGLEKYSLFGSINGSTKSLFKKGTF